MIVTVQCADCDRAFTTTLIGSRLTVKDIWDNMPDDWWIVGDWAHCPDHPPLFRGGSNELGTVSDIRVGEDRTRHD
ncbi:MAG: hypothetical protein M3440_07300 [Chloroflexota bacterium]|nr:hypothetical protein [Chloroflexota bacterium]